MLKALYLYQQSDNYLDPKSGILKISTKTVLQL